MSNRRHIGPRKRKMTPREADAMCVAAAMEERGDHPREITRTCCYIAEYGLEALEFGDQCVIFDVPSCEDWDCVNPDHQRLKYVAPGEACHGHSHDDHSQN